MDPKPVVILKQKREPGTPAVAPLKLSLPPTWLDAPCLKLLDTWAKKKKTAKRGEALELLAEDGTAVPEEWPIEAALALYGDEDDDGVVTATFKVRSYFP